MTITPDLLGVGAPCVVAFRNAVIIDRPGITLHPGWVGLGTEPFRSRSRKSVQRRPDRLDGAAQAVEGADGSKHVRAVRALPPTGHQQLLLPAQRQQRIKEQRLRPARHQPAAELAQHRGIEARVCQLQPEQILPVDPASGRIRCLPVRQVLSELQHHKSEPPRRFGWLPVAGEQRSELPIRKHRPKRVMQAQAGVAGPENSVCNSGRGRGSCRRRSRAERHHGSPKRRRLQHARENPPCAKPLPTSPAVSKPGQHHSVVVALPWRTWPKRIPYRMMVKRTITPGGSYSLRPAHLSSQLGCQSNMSGWVAAMWPYRVWKCSQPM